MAMESITTVDYSSHARFRFSLTNQAVTAPIATANDSENFSKTIEPFAGSIVLMKSLKGHMPFSMQSIRLKYQIQRNTVRTETLS